MHQITPDINIDHKGSSIGGQASDCDNIVDRTGNSI